MQRPIRFTAAGDILITRRLPAAGDSALREAIAASDVRLANLETTITDGTRYASAYSGGTWLTADPGCLADVARLGFNVLGFANNHTMDYSYGGLEDTLRFLRGRALRPPARGRTSLRPRAPRSWRRRAAARRSSPSAPRSRTPPARAARPRACPAGRASTPCACRPSTAWRARARRPCARPRRARA